MWDEFELKALKINIILKKLNDKAQPKLFDPDTSLAHYWFLMRSRVAFKGLFSRES